MSSVVVDGTVHALGAPERVFEQCTEVVPDAHQALLSMTGRGQRVVAVASRVWSGGTTPETVETGLQLQGLIGLEDPPRPDVADSLRACRTADIRVAMVTGDRPRTAEAIAREIRSAARGRACPRRVRHAR